MFSSISAYETSAEDFFEALKVRKVDLLLDVRLKNKNQLCGFTKSSDLAYLTRVICSADYIHDLALAPDAALLDRYLGHWITWDEYKAQYLARLKETDAKRHVDERYHHYQNICLLGTATKKRRSHTEVLEQFLRGDF